MIIRMVKVTIITTIITNKNSDPHADEKYRHR